MANEISYNRIKDNTRRKGIPTQQQTARKAEAEVRNAEYAKLTPQQKLARLDVGGFRAEKQRARLVAQIQQGAKK
jgi:hypothetical protein